SSTMYLVGSAALVAHIALSPDVNFTCTTVSPALSPRLLMLVSGGAAAAVGNMPSNRAIVVLSAGRTSMYQYWVPVFGVGFAILILGEVFTLWHVVGLTGIILGTYLGTSRR